MKAALPHLMFMFLGLTLIALLLWNEIAHLHMAGLL